MTVARMIQGAIVTGIIELPQIINEMREKAAQASQSVIQEYLSDLAMLKDIVEGLRQVRKDPQLMAEMMQDPDPEFDGLKNVILNAETIAADLQKLRLELLQKLAATQQPAAPREQNTLWSRRSTRTPYNLRDLPYHSRDSDAPFAIVPKR